MLSPISDTLTFQWHYLTNKSFTKSQVSAVYNDNHTAYSGCRLKLWANGSATLYATSKLTGYV